MHPTSSQLSRLESLTGEYMEVKGTRKKIKGGGVRKRREERTNEGREEET
jgi:hypothetical protein